ncbi:hypothetical protein E05_24890 [Plautia stali symbiont]|nr:hypothetical protein E05_24890 [Plautia stali symbiont]
MIIGIDMDETALRQQLHHALLTEEKMALGPDSWAQLPDPFQPWFD